ncbi:MAG: YicC family protein [Mogibacterium sp.]|nr:YicC family protein [Mogibacterium sp.]MBR4090717.1 YicC family protein [Mogibacterium sp.]
MIRSMTGFGRGEYSDEISKVTVEIRSVNHRYLDIYVKMPRRYSFAEETIKSAIKERVHRGKVEVSVSVDNVGRSDSDVRLDKELAARYYSVLSELRDSFDFGEESRVSLSLLSKMPDVIVTTPAAEDEEAMSKRLLGATVKALDDFCSMRETEGEKLAADLSARADTIQNIRDHIEKRAPEIEKEYAAKFKARVEEILGGVYEVPEERIALEAAIFADKANITEELVRLGSHISQLRSFLKSDGKEAIGKKIDFLIQEMNREANTIGSKSNDREITSNMLELKAEIEKVREQVQNIE